MTERRQRRDRSPRDLDGPLRNAAVLIRSLDYQLARRVLQSLRPAAAAQVSELAAKMGRVSAAEVRQAIKAFRASVEADQFATEESAPSPALIDRLDDPVSRVEAYSESEETSSCASNFQFASQDVVADVPEFEAELLVQTLERERPQVIAAVLAKKSPGEAAEVLQGLCEDLCTSLFPLRFHAESSSTASDAGVATLVRPRSTRFWRLNRRKARTETRNSR